jgi:uncharacterized 2Fe-2S/4Fe-4S cluster protein (DUF4445 family)
MLLSAQQREEVSQAVIDIEKIETATEPRFQELFVSAMAFPHATAPSPHLAQVITLPERSESETSGRRGRRRRATNQESRT